MELWVAGVALLVIAASILILILCGKKIRKGFRIAGVCVLGALFAAVLGYIVLTFLFLDALDSPSLDEPTISGTVLSEEQATLEALQKRKATISMKGKSRVIILPDPLCRTLLAYAKKQRLTSGAVFISRAGKPMNRSNIWRLMKNLCESANVKKEKVFPHALRHLFARTYYSLQKDVVRLADILGHTSVNTTRIYTMETGEVHRKQIEKLGLLRC